MRVERWNKCLMANYVPYTLVTYSGQNRIDQQRVLGTEMNNLTLAEDAYYMAELELGLSN